ncbi:hypothetical protein K7432_000243 [Basidiobolus ranarum]|uniref:Uncharacterized protein n=1 Tax=Basidiobolus ranarum TaxID=34480 RepID=A0ABR2X4V1_9FUNG
MEDAKYLEDTLAGMHTAFSSETEYSVTSEELIHLKYRLDLLVTHLRNQFSHSESLQSSIKNLEDLLERRQTTLKILQKELETPLVGFQEFLLRYRTSDKKEELLNELKNRKQKALKKKRELENGLKLNPILPF